MAAKPQPFTHATTVANLWRAFEDNEITHSAAHYLLAIAALQKAQGAPRAADVARHLAVSRAAASLQLRALQEHGLVSADSRARLHLSPAATDLVGRLASKRQVLRVFLRQILGVPEGTAEVDACKVEHLLSEETSAALVRWLRFLLSGEASARSCLETFRATTAHCPPGAHCDLCAEACLLAGGSG